MHSIPNFRPGIQLHITQGSCVSWAKSRLNCLFQFHVQWELEERSGVYSAYPELLNLKIETAFIEGASTMVFTSESTEYKIDFTKKAQIQIGIETSEVPIRRTCKPGKWCLFKSLQRHLHFKVIIR